jgi:hypothetical protein
MDLSAKLQEGPSVYGDLRRVYQPKEEITVVKIHPGVECGQNFVLILNILEKLRESVQQPVGNALLLVVVQDLLEVCYFFLAKNQNLGITIL